MNPESNPDQRKEELKEHVRQAYKVQEKYREIVTFAKQLKEDKPDAVNTELYHFLIGSTPEPYQTEQFDTPEHDIENFILNELTKTQD